MWLINLQLYSSINLCVCVCAWLVPCHHRDKADSWHSPRRPFIRLCCYSLTQLTSCKRGKDRVSPIHWHPPPSNRQLWLELEFVFLFMHLGSTRAEQRGQENTIVTLTLLYLAISVDPDSGNWCERIRNWKWKWTLSSLLHLRFNT